jgi:hypothetical protein
MSDQPRPSEDKQSAPCPLCAGTNFRWGKVGTGSSGTRFIEDEVGEGWFATPRNAPLVARECSDCGNVQWFTKE